jgi:hypothetical protein
MRGGGAGRGGAGCSPPLDHQAPTQHRTCVHTTHYSFPQITEWPRKRCCPPTLHSLTPSPLRFLAAPARQRPRPAHRPHHVLVRQPGPQAGARRRRVHGPRLCSVRGGMCGYGCGVCVEVGEGGGCGVDGCMDHGFARWGWDAGGGGWMVVGFVGMLVLSGVSFVEWLEFGGCPRWAAWPEGLGRNRMLPRRRVSAWHQVQPLGCGWCPPPLHPSHTPLWLAVFPTGPRSPGRPPMAPSTCCGSCRVGGLCTCVVAGGRVWVHACVCEGAGWAAAAAGRGRAARLCGSRDGSYLHAASAACRCSIFDLRFPPAACSHDCHTDTCPPPPPPPRMPPCSGGPRRCARVPAGPG